MTFMQRKLQRLREEHLAAFNGSSLGSEVPKLSRLEKEREVFKARKRDEKAQQKKAAQKDWTAQSLSDIFSNVAPRKSRLEREKEQALENAKNAADYVPVKKPTQVAAAVADPWSNVIKKRSRLEME